MVFAGDKMVFAGQNVLPSSRKNTNTPCSTTPQVLGRFFLRDYTTMAAVDQELIHHHPDLPDKFVVRANQHHPVAHSSPAASGYGATSLSSPTSGGGSGGRLMDDKVTHFYYQILADSFAKELPGVRRAEEELAALAGEREKWGSPDNSGKARLET